MTGLVHVVLCFTVLIIGNVSGKPDKTVCYYESWAVYRPGDGKFDVKDIDPMKCTHLIYAFVDIKEDGSIKLNDPDLDKKAIPSFNALKKKNTKLKTLVAIGGWSAGSKTFSKVAGDSGLRLNFANNALAFIQKYGFDGFDLDWEYPAQRGGSSNDKKNVVLMLKELRKAFDNSGKKLLLTAAVASSADGKSYDVPAFTKELDFVNLMAYDIHGSYDGVTGYNAPLHADENSVEASVKLWILRGCPANKLVLGMPMYGRSFTLKDSSKPGLNKPAGAGKKGPFTGEEGYLGYNEICLFKKQGGWTETWDDKAKVPVMYKGDQWVGFDNEKSIRLKAEFAVSKNLGGGMVWAIDTDDIHSLCGKKYGLMSAINKVFYGSANAGN